MDYMSDDARSKFTEYLQRWQTNLFEMAIGRSRPLSVANMTFATNVPQMKQRT
jgi:hypothetical protein